MPPFEIITADVLEWAAAYDGPLFHAILCDPPYHFTSIARRFGKPGAAPAQHGSDGAFTRASAGFMGQTWDGGDIAFRSETWAAFLPLLHPGAFGMAFASARGWHRLAVAIEDAGYVIHPSIFGWLHGQGFPKATRIDTQVDRRPNLDFGEVRTWLRRRVAELGLTHREIDGVLGNENSHKASHYLGESQPQLPTPEDWRAMKGLLGIEGAPPDVPQYIEFEREVVGYITKARKDDQGLPLPAGGSTQYKTWPITIPATDLARTWEHHRYGLQALKPALEPIIVFQKPYEGRPVDDITRTGAGALNIEAGRVMATKADIEAAKVPAPAFGTGQIYGMKPGTGRGEGRPLHNMNGGRWPANFALVHLPECWFSEEDDDQVAIPALDWAGPAMWHCAPGCPVASLDVQAGERVTGNLSPAQQLRGGFAGQRAGTIYGIAERGGTGEYPGDVGPASRFYFNADWNAEVEEGLFNADPAHFEPKADVEERERGLRFIVACSQAGKPGVEHRGDPCNTETHWLVRDGHEPIEVGCRRNGHPTVKPISLIRWLATLLLPPEAYAPRRILIPFAGVGSEVIAARQAQWEEVVGVELHEEYAAIARLRLAAYLGML